jgi:hypothetical protein
MVFPEFFYKTGIRVVQEGTVKSGMRLSVPCKYSIKRIKPNICR